MSIEIRNVSKRFGAFTALEHVNLDINGGDMLALLGPSGCGKTTLLRVIAGLEQPDTGQVVLHGRDATVTPVKDREIGFVFQHYALFRHLTVFENVAFGLRAKPRRHRPKEAAIRTRVHELLQLVQLDWLASGYPDQLSGGQRQRIALARALAVQPRVLLLDEPFGALDAKVRKELRRWLRDLHEQLNVTSVFVTHDQEEALEMADHIVVFNRGKVEQVGTPDQVYCQPASAFVDAFLGDVNVFQGRLVDGCAHVDEVRIQLPAGEQTQRSGPVTAYARPHEIGVARTGKGIAARVVRVRQSGPIARVTLVRQADGQILEVALPHLTQREMRLGRGETVRLQLQQPRVYMR